MPVRALTSSLCLLPLFVASAIAMPTAPETAYTFTRLATLLPCQPDITTLATGLGYREVAQTRMDIDYVDIEYSDESDQSRLTLAVENTPIGAHFSVLLDIPETDQAYADAIVMALRRNWSLPTPVHMQSLASGTAQFWKIGLPNGTAQITVRHDNLTTQISGILEPLARGTALPC